MKLFFPTSELVLPLHRRAELVSEFLAAGGREDEVYGFEASAESNLLFRDHVGQVCDVPRVLAGCVFNEPDLRRILWMCHTNGDRGVLLRGASKAEFRLEVSVDVIFAERTCVKSRSGNVGALEDFLATPTPEKAEVAS